MKQLRYIIQIELDKETKSQATNGAYIKTYSKIDDYNVQKQEITDDISASIYGARINNIIRLSSIRGVLENYLKNKMNESSDNITLYSVVLDGSRYKITTVKDHYIDIEL